MGGAVGSNELVDVVAFKASHFTRGKDGAPADVAFSLSADADKGDQDQLVCAPVVAAPLTAGGANTKGKGGYAGRRQEDEANLVASPAFSFQPRFDRNDRGAPLEEVAYPLTAEAGRTGKGDSAQCVAFSVSQNSNGFAWESDVHPTLQSRQQNAGANQFDGVRQGWSVRRLMPIECERLQGFQDGYTDIIFRGKSAADSPRYKVLGNSMSVNSMRWIGRRIQMVSEIEG